MKQLLFSLLMLMAVQTAQAYCITIIPTGRTSTSNSIEFSIDDMKVSLYRAIDDGAYIKISANGYLDFSTPCHQYITRVVLECASPDDEAYGPAHIWTYRGTYSYDGIYGILDGGKDYASLKVTDEIWIKRIRVYFDRQDGLSIFPRSTTQYTNQYQASHFKVNISSSYYDAKIYYTLDGSTPTVNSTEFINSFKLSQDATVKAIVVRDGAVIDSASTSYQCVNDAAYVNNINESLAVPDGTPVRFKNPIYVVRQMGPCLWVKDDSGYALILGDCSQNYFMGNEIAQVNSGYWFPYDFGVTKATINGIPVLTKPGGFHAARRGRNVEVEPEAVSLSQVNMDKFAHYVYVENLTISAGEEGQSYLLTDEAGNICKADFSTMNINVPGDLGQPYNIHAIVGADSIGTPELIVLKAPVGNDGEEPLLITPSQVGPSTCGHQVFMKQIQDFEVRDICDYEGESCESYIPFTYVVAAVLCWSYDVEGEVESYKYWSSGDFVTGYRLRISNFIIYHNLYDTADVKRIKSLYRLRDNKDFYLSGHFTEPLTAVYQNGDYLYVRDNYGDYGLVLGPLDAQFTNGDMIYDAKAQSYNDGGVDFITAADVSSFVPGGHQEAVLPKVLAIEAVTGDIVHNYIRLNGVRLAGDDSQGLQSMADDTGTLPLLNLFGIEITTDGGGDVGRYDVNGDGIVNISDAATLIDRLLSHSPMLRATRPDGTYDVTGFVAMQDNVLQFYPVEIVPHHLDGDIDADGNVNIGDITSLMDFILSSK